MTKILSILLLTSTLFGVSYAQEIPPTTNVDPLPTPDTLVEITSPQAAVVNREARLANQVYVTEVPALSQVKSKPFAIPDGYRMVEVEHPDKIICSAYPQASTWVLEKIAQPVTTQPVPKVGKDNVDAITVIVEGE